MRDGVEWVPRARLSSRSATVGSKAAGGRGTESTGMADTYGAGQAGASDESLYGAARRGSAEAFGQLYARHRDGLWRFLLAWSGDAHLAEDVLQDAFVAVMTRGPMAAEAFHFRAYLYRAAMNRARDVFRRRGYETLADSDDGVQQLAAAGRQEVAFTERVEARDALARALDRLSPEQRAALSLHYFADLPVQQVADVLGVPVGTVKTRLARSYPRLLAELRKDES